MATDATLETPTSKQDSGHAQHTQPSDSQEGLPGAMPRPIHIAFLGAGSGFCIRLVPDIFSIKNCPGGEIRLVDIDPDRLGTMKQVIQNIAKQMGVADRWKIIASTERKDILPGLHYAICCVEVSGTQAVALDNDIPLKYGIDQCIGDTIGPGGLFKAMRTVPVFLDILRDMAQLCPEAVMLNYTNPMSMMCLAAGRSVPQVPVVGLCHSVQGTSHLMAEYADIPYAQLRWECAGINHLAWFTKLQHHGQDLYKKVLNQQFENDLAQAQQEEQAGLTSYDDTQGGFDPYRDGDRLDALSYKMVDLVRKDMCLHFGAFITESSGHLSEYLPYYRKSEAGRKYLRNDYHGGSRFYASNWPNWRKQADQKRLAILQGDEKADLQRTWEYGSWIIEAMEKDQPIRIHGNVMNTANMPGKTSPGEAGKLITNLPGDGCVEVACLIDASGIQPVRYGALPPQMAHICASNMAMFDLGATACIDQSKEAGIHALMLDPLCQAVCTPKQIKQMALEMFEAEKELLPYFK